MSNRRTDVGLMIAAVVVALFVGTLAFYSGVLAPGYNSNVQNYEHSIEAGPGENVTSEVELGDGTDLEHITYRYEELSPIAQELFDRTRTADSATYTPDICREHVVVCDGYYQDELPSEFRYGAGLDDASLYTIIEYDGDEYLLRTGSPYTHNNPNFFYGFLSMFFRGLLILHAGALVIATLMRWRQETSTNTQLYTILIGTGVLVGIVGFSIPYIEMAGLVSYQGELVRLVTAVTLGYTIIAFIWLIVAVVQR